MQEKWNQFVYVLCEAKKKDVDEDTYHTLIENQLQLLNWMMYKGEIGKDKLLTSDGQAQLTQLFKDELKRKK